MNDFLQFARPGEPELTLLPAELPLREVQLLLGPPLGELQIRLVLEPSAPMRIKADAAQLKQVLISRRPCNASWPTKAMTWRWNNVATRGWRAPSKKPSTSF